MTNGESDAFDRSSIILAEATGDLTSLLDALTAADHSMRALALGALDRSGELTDGHLQSALADAERDVRCRALELSIDRTDIELVPHLTDADDLVVETAAFALGERGDRSADIIAALTDVGLHHEVSICREAAIAALGALGDEAGLPAILAGLDDRAPVRRRAVLALAPFDTPEVTAALERATTDRDRQVRQAAEDLR